MVLWVEDELHWAGFEIRQWASRFFTFDDAWAACGRGDWMIEILVERSRARVGGGEHRALVLAVAGMAEMQRAIQSEESRRARPYALRRGVDAVEIFFYPHEMKNLRLRRTAECPGAVRVGRGS